MQKRQLGRSGLSIAPLMLGTNVFGWTADEKTSFAILDAFVDAGFNAVDTANVYSMFAGTEAGLSEMIIGRWIKATGKRDKIVLATKVGSDMKDGDGRCNRKDYILRHAEASLKRLQTDVIDLYQTHNDDLVTPPEETMSAYGELVKQGKVRVIGTSNMSPERIMASLAASKAKGLPRYETLQPLYNLYDRDIEKTHVPLCQSEHISVIPYYSLAAGFLSGKYRSLDDTKKAPRAAKLANYANDRGFKIVAALNEVAKRNNVTAAQAAIAWVKDRPTIAAPIASATSVAQLNDLIKGAQLTLPKGDMDALTRAGD